MSKPIQQTAALIICNGYRVAPYVTAFPPGYNYPRETQAFRQLTAYMARYKELETIGGTAWRPFDRFSDASGPLGVALAPWLRGGARYLQSTLAPLGMNLLEPEQLPIDHWFKDIQALADCLPEQVDGQLTASTLDKVRQVWDRQHSLNGRHDKALHQYYSDVQIAIEHLGLESNLQRIAEMRRKNRIASTSHSV
jgi:hypothetical protein